MGLPWGGQRDGGSCPAVGTHLLLQMCVGAGYDKGWMKEFKYLEVGLDDL